MSNHDQWVLDFDGTLYGPFDSNADARAYGDHLANQDRGPHVSHEWNATPVMRPYVSGPLQSLRDGALVDDLPELDRFQITGRGTVIVTLPLYNRAAMSGRVVHLGGVLCLVLGVENCLVMGHHEGECDKPTGLLVKFL